MEETASIDEIIEKLPPHWTIIYPNEKDNFFDDGRDYNKPMFIRKDGMARIYFNELESDNSPYRFAIALEGDGDCCGNFENAIAIADAYVADYLT